MRAAKAGRRLGEVAEWSNALAWKASRPLPVSGVRISPSPNDPLRSRGDRYQHSSAISNRFQAARSRRLGARVSHHAVLACYRRSRRVLSLSVRAGNDVLRWVCHRGGARSSSRAWQRASRPGCVDHCSSVVGCIRTRLCDLRIHVSIVYRSFCRNRDPSHRRIHIRTRGLHRWRASACDLFHRRSWRVVRGANTLRTPSLGPGNPGHRLLRIVVLLVHLRRDGAFNRGLGGALHMGFSSFRFARSAAKLKFA